jgi:glutamate dehydrogenase (NAD(P)+)
MVSLIPLAADRAGVPAEGATVAIQGFGNVGLYAAVAADELGTKVVAISDVSGGVYNPKGIPIADAVTWVQNEKSLAGFTGGGERITNEELLELDVQILMPCATGGVITKDNAADVKAKLVLEGANGPTTIEGDRILLDNGVLVVPDILANAGGVTVSYFEWVQDVQKYFWTENEVVARLREIMTRAFSDVHNIAQSENVDMRTAALIKGIRKVADAKLVRGIFP